MDFEILPQLLIILSISGILIIIGKNFSKIKQQEQKEIFLQDIEEKEEKEKFLYLYKRAIRRFVNKEKYSEKVSAFWVWLEKFLRKARIAFLKFDSKILKTLNDLRQKNVKKAQEETAKKEEEENFSEHELGMKTIETQPQNDEIFVKNEEKLEEEITEEENVVTDTVITNKEEADEVEESVDSKEEENITIDKNEEKDKIEKSLDKSEASKSEEVKEEKEEKVEEIKSEEDTENESKRVHTKKEDEYIEALMKDPRDVKSYWKLGTLYSKRKNYDDALACFRQIVKIDPTYTKAKQKALELMEKMKGISGDPK